MALHLVVAADLRTVAVHWPDLVAALGTTGTASWPPAGRMADYLRALDQVDEELAEAARWQAAYTRQFLDRNPSQVGATRPPLRIEILDTMRTVEQLLLEVADQTAAAVQRPSMSLGPRSWPAAERARRNAVARDDAADRRRWRYTGQRSAPKAALWLLGRVQGAPGPFRPLAAPQRDRITAVARDAAARVETALDIGARRATLKQRHDCGGRIDVYGGEGQPPTAHCGGCGRIWSGQNAAAVA